MSTNQGNQNRPDTTKRPADSERGTQVPGKQGDVNPRQDKQAPGAKPHGQGPAHRDAGAGGRMTKEPRMEAPEDY